MIESTVFPSETDRGNQIGIGTVQLGMPYGPQNESPPSKQESIKFLSESNAFTLPKMFIPPVMHNHGNYIISLGSFCKWLSTEAEKLGVEILVSAWKVLDSASKSWLGD